MINLPGTLAGVVSDAESSIQKLDAAARPALTPLARLLLRSESIASSRVEGMRVGARQLARAEVDTSGRASSTAREIVANIDAMEVAVHVAANADRFSVDEIVAIHRKLMESSPYPHIAGRIRTVQNWIGGNDHNPCGADFVPPPPEYLDALLADLCEAIEDEELPPLVQAALVHAQFETIHPFDDGNGRTGRALIHVVLRRRGVAVDYVPPISVVLARARDRYIQGLTNYRDDRVEDWIEQFAVAAATAARLASAYVAAVADLTDRWRTQLAASAKAPRSDAAAWVLIDSLPAHPTLTAPIAVAATGRSKPQIYLALEQLETAGVLVPLTQARRNQLWEPHGLIDLLERLESGESPPRE